MSSPIALCLDERACCNPELVGLDGEALEAQEWLRVYPDGLGARSSIGSDASIKEAWVVSCDDVDPINLAATLKADRPDLCVRLVTDDGCGSLYSRAHTAHIDEVLERRAFVRRYAEAKRKSLEVSSRAGAGIELPTVAEPRRATGEVGPPLLVVQPAERLPQVEEAPRAYAPAAQRRGFMVPVVSGSGGAGKSTVSVLAAHNAAARGLRTLLLDYDLQFGDVARMSRVDNPLSVDEAISHPEKLEREIAKGDLLTVLAAPARLETAEEIASALPSLLDEVITRFDVVVANTGAAWAEHHAALLERSTVALFLIDQRMSSVRACCHALELCSRCGIATGPFRFVLNRCAKGAPLTSVDVSSALRGASVYELKDGGRDVEDCLSGGAIEELIGSGNELVSSIDRLMGQLLPAGDSPASSSDRMEERAKVVKRRSRMGRRRGRKTS